MYGDFGGANVISTYGAFNFTPNLSTELWVSQVARAVLRQSAGHDEHRALDVPENRVRRRISRSAPASSTPPEGHAGRDGGSTDSLAQVGVGMRALSDSRRFVFRAEYKAHVVFTSRDDNEEVREWKAGFSFFF